MSSVTRLTIALAVIMVEISDDVHMLLPVLIGIMVAKWVADAVTHSLYHALLEVKCVPFLSPEPVSRFSLDLMPISSVMHSPVVCLELNMKVRSYLDEHDGAYEYALACRAQGVMNTVLRCLLAGKTYCCWCKGHHKMYMQCTQAQVKVMLRSRLLDCLQVGDLQATLRDTSHNGYPVVRDSSSGQICLGLISRAHLLVLLQQVIYAYDTHQSDRLVNGSTRAEQHAQHEQRQQAVLTREVSALGMLRRTFKQWLAV
jgi:hypothetical protein